MFGNKSKPSRIYAYKARKATQGRERIADQLWKAHHYRNKLVEIERQRRARIEEFLRVYAPEVHQLTESRETALAALNAIKDQIKAKNSASRKKLALAADRESLAVARQTLKEISVRLKQSRKDAFADTFVKVAIARLSTEVAVTTKTARKECGLYWGNYLRVEQSMSDAKSGAPPDFRRWSPDGSIGVQIQGGMIWDEVLAAEDSRFRIVVRPPSPDADPNSRRSRETPMADAWIRVGSEGRAPIWAIVPFRLHRQPPEGAILKQLSLHRRIVGNHESWELQLILSRDDWDKEDNATEGAAGLDVNWRVFSQGLRVATLIGDDGKEESLFLPRTLLDAWAKAESLQSIRDRTFEEIRPKLVAWIDSRKRQFGETEAGEPAFSEEFTKRFAHLYQWKSKERLVRAIRWWADNRVPGDDVIFAEMFAWRKQDCHLHDWEDCQRQKNARKRNEIYRRFAAIVRRHYKTVAIEDTSWSDLARLPGPDEPSDDFARIYSRVASVGKLIQFIKEAVTEVVKVDAKNTTKNCHSCGHLNDFDAARNVNHTCSGCGLTWDQDRNAALNLLGGLVNREPVAA